MNKRYSKIQNDIYDVIRVANYGMTPKDVADKLPRASMNHQVVQGLRNLINKGLVYKKDGLYFYTDAPTPTELIIKYKPVEESTTEIPSIIEDIAFIIQDYQKLLIEHKRLKEDFDALHHQYCNIQSSMNGVKKLQAQLGRR